MKIVLVSPYPPERDGIGAYAALFRDELVNQGHEVAVVSARATDGTPAEVIGSLPTTRRRSIEPLADTVRAFAPDVVHVQFAVAAYGRLLWPLLGFVDRLREAGLPMVITLHEITRDIDSLRAAGRALYRNVARRATELVVHTGAARIAVERTIGPQRPPVTVIAHPRAELPAGGVAPSELRARFGLGTDRVALAFGFIDVDKGLGDLIAAVGRLEATDALQGVRIVVAGAVRRRFGGFRVFELRDRLHLGLLHRRVASHGLGHRVLFVGYVPAGEVRAWLEMATVVVLPYRRSEQSGVASLAVAAGSPLLTSNVGELPAVSSYPAFPPADPAALAVQLHRSLERRPAERSGDREQGDLPEIVRQTSALYRRLALENRPVSLSL